MTLRAAPGRPWTRGGDPTHPAAASHCPDEGSLREPARPPPRHGVPLLRGCGVFPWKRGLRDLAPRAPRALRSPPLSLQVRLRQSGFEQFFFGKLSRKMEPVSTFSDEEEKTSRAVAFVATVRRSLAGRLPEQLAAVLVGLGHGLGTAARRDGGTARGPGRCGAWCGAWCGAGGRSGMEWSFAGCQMSRPADWPAACLAACRQLRLPAPGGGEGEPKNTKVLAELAAVAVPRARESTACTRVGADVRLSPSACRLSRSPSCSAPGYARLDGVLCRSHCAFLRSGTEEAGCSDVPPCSACLCLPPACPED